MILMTYIHVTRKNSVRRTLGEAVGLVPPRRLISGKRASLMLIKRPRHLITLLEYS
jgi:hypothetical protein